MKYRDFLTTTYLTFIQKIGELTTKTKTKSVNKWHIFVLWIFKCGKQFHTWLWQSE